MIDFLLLTLFNTAACIALPKLLSLLLAPKTNSTTPATTASNQRAFASMG